MGTIRAMPEPETTSQDALTELARRAPGVRVAAEVVGRLRPHVPTLPSFTTTVTAYSTGGNAEPSPL